MSTLLYVMPSLILFISEGPYSTGLLMVGSKMALIVIGSFL